ncbi:hypothetical protein [Dyadobacter psychrotolerans]|uniref:Uncharacterized protein n=1 Tax=Dyadobacter psychrotolerans TaxID=2541721 RepID=A0A4R5DMT6_9BACT|nr:hypothetical protein [Dyadobacter psychrotolerans]TDE14837.1 hypothetical protein E0F88_16790 [Dyadobacter psychrotolerans]
MVDTAFVLATFLEIIDSEAYGVIKTSVLPKLEDADEFVSKNYCARVISDDLNKSFDQRAYSGDSFDKLYVKLAKVYFSKLDSARTVRDVNEFIFSGLGRRDARLDKLLTDLKDVLSRLATRDTQLSSKEIELAAPYWAKKNLQWLTISPGIGINAYKTYGRDEKNQVIDPKNTTFLTPKVAGWYSFYSVLEKASRLYRIGIEGIVANNLKDFKEIKYYERDTLLIEPNGNAVISEETTSGIFRDQASKKGYKFIVNLRGEFYLLPKKNFIPGLSVKTGFVRSGMLETDKRRFEIQIGTIINIFNKEKNKPVLTLQPYFSMDNLLKQQEKTRQGLVRNLRGSEKLSAGMLLGLPIQGLLSVKD